MNRILVIAVALLTSTAFAQEETRDLPDSGSFGLRVGSSHIAPLGGAVGMLEGRIFLTDDLALDVGVGLGMVVTNVAVVGFNVGAGVSYFFNGSGRFRPFLTGGLGLGNRPAVLPTGISLSFNAGGGAEYWFSRHFSVAGRALFVVNPVFTVGTTIAFFSPGVALTWYFN